MKTIVSKRAFLALVALGALLGAWARPAVAGELPVEDLARRVNAFLDQPGFRSVQFSASIIRCPGGETLYERNAHLALMPASNMKVVTSAAALEALGADFAFTTKVGLCGDALVVIGSGDPLLGYQELEPRHAPYHSPQILPEIVGRLKGLGVTSVSDIILDASVFDADRVCPTWPRDQLRQRYACEVSGLNYNGNCVEISAANRQGRVVLMVDPPTEYIRLINSVSVGPDAKSWFSVEPTGKPCEFLIQGSCRTQAGPYSVAVENPTLFFGTLVRESLRKAGIAVTGRLVEGRAPEGCELKPVVEFRTPIGDCLQQMNKNSFGLVAEAFFKTLSARAHADGLGGTWEGGRQAVANYLGGAGLDVGEYAVADGSGLSRENRLSSYALSRVLLRMAARQDWEFYKNSLSVGGVDGTLESHFWEPPYRGRVQAKTGYIQGVRALSGYVHTESGDFVFSMIANRGGGPARTAMDESVKAIMDWAAGRPATLRGVARPAGAAAVGRTRAGSAARLRPSTNK